MKKNVFFLGLLFVFFNSSFAQQQIINSSFNYEIQIEQVPNFDDIYSLSVEDDIILKQLLNAPKANTPIACDVHDSLALVAIYNSTNGASWTNNDFWLTDSVYKWHGVTIDNVGRISVLDLMSNNLTGTIPAEIGNLPFLQGLMLSSNQLTGSIPPEIGDLSSLAYLYLYGNKLSGNIPAELCQLSKLFMLYLFNNNLDGVIPPEIGLMTNMMMLNLANNNFTGSIPVEIGQLKKLTDLKLMSNQLTGEIPEELGHLPLLRYLFIGHNNIEGYIPESLGSLIKLERLNLSSTLLNGKIPEEIWDLTSLQVIDLSNNQFSGTISNKIKNLTALTGLYLTANLFYGQIPEEIGQLTELTYMNISNNYFVDSIPYTFSDLVKLQYLFISNNELSILKDFSSLPNLIHLDAGFNKFSFEDFEPFISISTLIEGPQAKVDEAESFNPDIGSNFSMAVVVGGDNNTYQWYKDESLILGATSNVFQKDNFAEGDKGIYYCEIRNTVVTGLTLTSYNKYVGVDIPDYDISVSVNPLNSGTFVGDGNYNEGNNVSLNAKANLGYHFVNWEEGSDTIYGNTTYNFIATDNRTLIANFASNTFTITTTVNPLSSGTIEQIYSFNDDVSIFANSLPGYIFVNWKEADTVVTTDSVYNFKADANRTFVANFEVYVDIDEQQHNLNIYPNPADKMIFISLNNSKSNSLVRIFNISGKLVYQNIISSNNTSIDVSNYNPGVYILEIENNSVIKKQKLIIK